MFFPQNFIPVPKSSQHRRCRSQWVRYLRSTQCLAPQIHTDSVCRSGDVELTSLFQKVGDDPWWSPHFFCCEELGQIQSPKNSIFSWGFHGYMDHIWTIYGPFLTISDRGRGHRGHRGQALDHRSHFNRGEPSDPWRSQPLWRWASFQFLAILPSGKLTFCYGKSPCY